MRRRNKYRAVRTNGFASKLEAALYELLKARESSGEIRDVRCQQSVVLVPGPVKIRIAWKVDFSFVDAASGATSYAEAKGVECATYKLKLKLWRANPPARLEIWKGTYRKLVLAEVVERREAA